MPPLDHEIEATKAAILAAMSGTTVRAGRVMGPAGCIGHGVIRLRRADGVAMAAAPVAALACQQRRPAELPPPERLVDPATDDMLALMRRRRPAR